MMVDDTIPIQESYAELERTLMEEYLGRTLESLKELPEEEARALRAAASLYASNRLEAIKARAHMVEELHGPPPQL